MTTERTHEVVAGGKDMTDRYIGPSAALMADLLPHRVSFERGWFWTTTAICHGGRSDGLAFRQRPDGEGIDARCHTRGCTRGMVITHLEALVGLPIWTAYEPVGDAPKMSWRKWWTPKRTAVAGVIALVVAAPLLLGHRPEAAILNLVGQGVAALLVWRLTRRIRRWVSRQTDSTKTPI